MHTTLNRALATAAAAVVAALAAAAPPLFSNLEYDAALEASAGQSRLLIVDATAEWCGPCKLMDRTTWVDPRVVEWIGEHALAVQVDVDEQRPLAQRLRIAAMPTVIAFKDGEEFDRIVGYRDAEGLLEWLSGMREGHRAIDALREKAAGGAGGQDVMARHKLAAGLLQAGNHEEALAEYEWLWLHALDHQPAFVGVRGSFMAGEMQRLAEAHRPARERFKAIRDGLETGLKEGDADQKALSDWIILNNVVGDADRTVAWVERVVGRPGADRAFSRNQHHLAPLLQERGRWELYGRIVADPNEIVRARIQTYRMIKQMARDDGLTPTQVDDLREPAIKEIANLHAALLAAGRTEDAHRVLEALNEGFDLDYTSGALLARSDRLAGG